MRKIIIKFSIVLSLALLLLGWLLYFPPLTLSQKIIQTAIPVSGILMTGIFVAVLILFQKEILKVNPGITLLQLTLTGILISFIAIVCFQLLMQFNFDINLLKARARFFSMGTAVMTFYATLLSLCVGFQLKKKNVGQLLLVILGCIALYTLIGYCLIILTGAVL